MAGLVAGVADGVVGAQRHDLGLDVERVLEQRRGRITLVEA